jgi:UDP:flavonoid glycosyltransferase YjiC (YdhE family)
VTGLPHLRYLYWTGYVGHLAKTTGWLYCIKSLFHLAHPNVRLFITHCGLLSTQEAIDRGVPIVGIPIYGDQRYNLARIVSFGIGIQLDYENITSESVMWALNEVLNNQR